MPSPAHDPQLLLDHVPDVVVVGSNTGTFEWVSPSVRGVLGWEPDDLVGTPFLQLVHPDDAQRVHGVQRGILNGVANIGDVRLRQSNNTYRWMSVSVRPQVDEHGQVTGRVACWHDIQSHVDEHAHDRIVIDRLQSALHAMTDPYVWLGAVRSPDGRVDDLVVVAANSAASAHVGLPGHDLRGRILSEATTRQQFTFVLRIASRVLASGEPFAADGLEVVDERPGYYDIRITRIDDDSVALLWRDVTAREELRSLRADLVIAEAEARERGRLARDLHDGLLQQIIASGMVLSQLLPTANASTRTVVERILELQNDQVRHIRSLMLGMAEPTMTLRSLEANLEQVVGEAARVLGFRPTLRLSGDTGSVDPVCAEQLLYSLRELLSNVAQHARATAVSIEVDAVGEAGPRPLPPERPRHVGPEVVAAQRADLAAAPAHASTPSGGVTLTVTDNGVGYEPHESHGRGLLNLASRAHFFGGCFSIERGATDGTTATWTATTNRAAT